MVYGVVAHLSQLNLYISNGAGGGGYIVLGSKPLVYRLPIPRLTNASK